MSTPRGYCAKCDGADVPMHFIDCPKRDEVKVSPVDSFVTVEMLRDWLARHDLKLEDVVRVDIAASTGEIYLTEDVIDRQVFIRVERMVRDASGSRFAIHPPPVGQQITRPAFEVLLIPIRDLPGEEK